MTLKEEARHLREYERRKSGKEPSNHNTHSLREKNRKKRKRAEQSVIWKIEHPTSVRGHVMKWRKKSTDKYNAYMRAYMARRNQALQAV